MLNQIEELEGKEISGRNRIDAEAQTVRLFLNLVYEEIPSKLVGVSRMAKPHQTDNAVTPRVK